MKLLKYIAVIIMIFENFPVFGQVTITSTASAQIVPLTLISEIQPLSFGQFTPLGDGGSIIISPQGVRSSTGSIVLKESAISPAVFTISGIKDNNISVILPANNINIYHQNGIKAMYLNAWTVNIPQSDISNQNNDYIIKIGCTLNIASMDANPVGIYQGTYPLTFIYN